MGKAGKKSAHKSRLISSSAAAVKKAKTSSAKKIKEGTSSLEGLSRGQRKRLAKRQQYLQRENLIKSSLNLQKQQPKIRPLDVDTLQGAIKDIVASSSGDDAVKAAALKQRQFVKSNKKKQYIMNAEISHVGLVMQHPQFQADPFSAMQMHLKNTLK